MNIKEMVGKNKTVKFVRYREGEFIYVTECGFEFPVPIADIGTATLLAQDKAILFLRYIRKHVETKEIEKNTIEISTPIEEFPETTVEGTLKAFEHLINSMKIIDTRK
jgi:hypothetical protein